MIKKDKHKNAYDFGEQIKYIMGTKDIIINESK